MAENKAGRKPKFKEGVQTKSIKLLIPSLSEKDVKRRCAEVIKPFTAGYTCISFFDLSNEQCKSGNCLGCEWHLKDNEKPLADLFKGFYDDIQDICSDFEKKLNK